MIAIASRDTLSLAGAAEPVGADRSASAPWSPVFIAVDRCKGCALCVGACAKGSLALDEGRVNVLGYHPVALVDAGSCTSCALCARVCPDCVLTILAPSRAARASRKAAS
jgi:2-oxoglutarate ferredoxin oxidoreductase subunit delta